MLILFHRTNLHIKTPSMHSVSSSAAFDEDRLETYRDHNMFPTSHVALLNKGVTHLRVAHQGFCQSASTTKHGPSALPFTLRQVSVLHGGMMATLSAIQERHTLCRPSVYLLMHICKAKCFKYLAAPTQKIDSMGWTSHDNSVFLINIKKENKKTQFS